MTTSSRLRPITTARTETAMGRPSPRFCPYACPSAAAEAREQSPRARPVQTQTRRRSPPAPHPSRASPPLSFRHFRHASAGRGRALDVAADVPDGERQHGQRAGRQRRDEPGGEYRREGHGRDAAGELAHDHVISGLRRGEQTHRHVVAHRARRARRASARGRTAAKRRARAVGRPLRARARAASRIRTEAPCRSAGAMRRARSAKPPRRTRRRARRGRDARAGERRHRRARAWIQALEPRRDAPLRCVRALHQYRLVFLSTRHTACERNVVV